MGKIDLRLLGYCGIYCGSCDIYMSCRAGDREKQQEIADWLKEHHSADCTAEEIRCSGCHGPLDEHWSADCSRYSSLSRLLRLLSRCCTASVPDTKHTIR